MESKWGKEEQMSNSAISDGGEECFVTLGAMWWKPCLNIERSLTVIRGNVTLIWHRIAKTRG